MHQNAVHDHYFQTVCAFLAIQIVAVAGRVYVRTGIVKAFGWDDAACVVTLIVACAYDACLIELFLLAGGAVQLSAIHPLTRLFSTVNLILIAEVLYIAATTLLKIALGLLLSRVLVRRWMKWTIWIVMAISVIYGIIYFFIVLFQCGMPSNFFIQIVKGQCLSRATIDITSYLHAVLVALADIVYGSLPILFLWNAEFSKRAKYSIGGILIVGSVGCICTFIRIGWIHYLAKPTNDYISTSRGIATLSSVELSIGLLCLSLATYKPLIHRIMGRPPTPHYGYYSQTGRSQQSTFEENGETMTFPDQSFRPNDLIQDPLPDVAEKSGKAFDCSSPSADSTSEHSDSWRYTGRAV